MSSLIVFSNNTGVYIGTDTLSHIKGNDKIIPKSFIAKTIYLPQFKCCFAVQGFAILIDKLFSFAMQRVVAYDASSFFESCKRDFFHNLNIMECDQDHIGTIFIIGYSIEAKSMKTYKMTVNKQAIEFETLGDCSFIKPMISNFDEIVQNANAVIKDQEPYLYYRFLITEIMKQQISEDTTLTIADKVVIGGQLQLTYMPIIGEDGNPSYLIEMAHTFDNYLEDYRVMLKQLRS